MFRQSPTRRRRRVTAALSAQYLITSVTWDTPGMSLSRVQFGTTQRASSPPMAARAQVSSLYTIFLETLPFRNH